MCPQAHKTPTEMSISVPGETLPARLPMDRLSLRNNRLKLETSGDLPIILEESMVEYTSSNEWKQNWKMSTYMEPAGFRITGTLTDYICTNTSRATTGANRQFVTDEPVEVQGCRNITVHFRGVYISIYPNLIKETHWPEGVNMSPTTGWSCKHSDPNRWLCPKISPDHRSRALVWKWSLWEGTKGANVAST